MEIVSENLEKPRNSVYDLISTKFEVRDFASKRVPAEVKRRVLNIARLTGSGMNAQHWRFVLVQNRANLKKLAEDSTTGLWVESADFAVIVLTNPRYAFHMIDAGRAIQDMMVTAWSYEVASGLYTGVNSKAMAADFNLPSDMKLTAVVGFGYPFKQIVGKKNRKPLNEIAFLERYSAPLNL